MMTIIAIAVALLFTLAGPEKAVAGYEMDEGLRAQLRALAASQVPQPTKVGGFVLPLQQVHVKKHMDDRVLGAYFERITVDGSHVQETWQLEEWVPVPKEGTIKVTYWLFTDAAAITFSRKIRASDARVLPETTTENRRVPKEDPQAIEKSEAAQRLLRTAGTKTQHEASRRPVGARLQHF